VDLSAEYYDFTIHAIAKAWETWIPSASPMGYDGAAEPLEWLQARDLAYG
jgi:hypothetical protein